MIRDGKKEYNFVSDECCNSIMISAINISNDIFEIFWDTPLIGGRG